MKINRQQFLDVMKWQTQSMGQSPSREQNNISGYKDMPALLWNPKIHCCVQMMPQLECIVNRVNPVYTVITCLFNIYFAYIF